mmetsp:Transcript_117147/g.203975  ORF Transcript_117147/g.203975 Transcript_117147/m.203975 type:complete len:278 (-) Transcript_117147:1151-1984(-)
MISVAGGVSGETVAMTCTERLKVGWAVRVAVRSAKAECVVGEGPSRGELGALACWRVGRSSRLSHVQLTRTVGRTRSFLPTTPSQAWAVGSRVVAKDDSENVDTTETVERRRDPLLVWGRIGSMRSSRILTSAPGSPLVMAVVYLSRTCRSAARRDVLQSCSPSSTIQMPEVKPPASPFMSRAAESSIASETLTVAQPLPRTLASSCTPLVAAATSPAPLVLTETSSGCRWALKTCMHVARSSMEGGWLSAQSWKIYPYSTSTPFRLAMHVSRTSLQ